MPGNVHILHSDPAQPQDHCDRRRILVYLHSRTMSKGSSAYLGLDKASLPLGFWPHFCRAANATSKAARTTAGANADIAATWTATTAVGRRYGCQTGWVRNSFSTVHPVKEIKVFMRFINIFLFLVIKKNISLKKLKIEPVHNSTEYIKNQPSQ